MNVKLVLVVLAVALVGSLAILVSRDGASAASAEEQAAVEPADALLQASEGLVAEAPDERREPGAAAPAPAETERARSAGSDAPPAAAEATAADVVRGRVIDATSRPIGGVEIRRGGGGETPRGGGETARGKDAESSAAIALDEGGAALRTAADGTFEIAADALGGNRPLLVEDAGWTTVLGGSPVRASTGRETAIVVAPRVSLVGRVIDDTAGAPVGGADVRVQPPADLRAGIDANLDYSVNRDWSVRTEPDGSFALDAPLLEGALLVARAKGFETSSEPLPPGGEHVIVLTAAPLASDVLRGRVIDAAGGVVPGAQVSLGLDTTRTDEAGEFAFRFDDERSFHRRLNEMRERRGHSALVADTLLALAPGALPGRYTAPRNGAGEPVWPGFVTLRLGAEPREIGGRVLDFDGEPIADATVWIADPTFFGGLAGESPGGMPDMVHAETVLAGGPTRAWTTTETDEDGRYLIGGLLDRDYRIEAMDPDTMLRAVLEDVASGTHNAVLRMPEEAVYPTLSGVVIGNDGEPVAGASVFPMCDAFVLTVGGATMSTNHASVDGVTTDADGKFALVGVPKELVYLRIQGAEVLPLEWGRHVEGGLASLVDERPEKLQIRVDRRCQFLVELIEPSEADEFELFAADGRQLEISEFFGTQRREGTRKSLIDGRSNPMAASDAAAEIVLYLEGEEVRRAPVRLLPGERRTLQP